MGRFHPKCFVHSCVITVCDFSVRLAGYVGTGPEVSLSGDVSPCHEHHPPFPEKRPQKPQCSSNTDQEVNRRGGAEWAYLYI